MKISCCKKSIALPVWKSMLILLYWKLLMEIASKRIHGLVTYLHLFSFVAV